MYIILFYVIAIPDDEDRLAPVLEGDPPSSAAAHFSPRRVRIKLGSKLDYLPVSGRGYIFVA